MATSPSPAAALAGPKSSIRAKILWAMLLLGGTVLALAAVSGFLSSSSALRKAAFNQLKSVGATKAEAIESYYRNARYELASQAESLTVQAALRELSAGRGRLMEDLKLDAPTVEAMRGEVRGYYANVLINALKKVRSTPPGTPENYMHADFEATVLQYLYTVKNPAEVGSKFERNSTEDLSSIPGLPVAVRVNIAKSAYVRAHSVYHPIFTDLRKRHGYYDIFIVDAEGYVVYTNFKELDFQGNLKTGPEKNTGLAEAYNAAMKASRDSTLDGSVILTDFAPYPKSYDAPAQFAAAAIYDSTGQKRGALIYQLPVDKINAVMTSSGQQEAIGLGKSGESYLIGKDYVQRTDSRFLDETPKTGKRKILGSDAKTEAETTIGVLRIRTPDDKVTLGAERAFSGEPGGGQATYPDYRGVPVLGYYRPLDIKGLNYGLLAEIDQKEAFSPVRSQLWQTLGVSLLGLLLTGGAASLVANQFAKPIRALAGVANKIGAGDSVARAEVSTDDEIGALAGSFNSMVEARNQTEAKIIKENTDLQKQIRELLVVVSDASDGNLGVRAQVTAGSMGNVADALNLMLENVGDLITQAKQASDEVAKSANEIAQAAAELDQGAQRQSTEVGATSAGVTQLNQYAQKVLGSCQTATRASENTRGAAEQGAEAVRAVISSMDRIRGNTQANSKKIKRLGDRSLEISGIVKVIADLSAKTDMLALNASIEAARAGEQGRGFSVVAEQVRSLADRTRSLTGQIEKLVNDITLETTEAGVQMENQTQEVEGGSRTATTAGATLERIVSATHESASLVVQINEAATAQAAGALKMLQSMDSINRATAVAQTKVREARAISERLRELSGEMNGQLAKFEVTATK